MVVRDVDVSVDRGEIVGLLGPNGAGKTTTFYMITGMIKPSKGHVFLDKTNITQKAMYKRARKGIGYLAQEPSIFGKLSVEDNLLLVLEMIEGLSKNDQLEKKNRLLEDLSVSHLAKSKGSTLSGGERRRVEIARSLCMDPDFILLDEPFAALDVMTIKMLQQIIVNLQSQNNISIILCDHQARDLLTCVDVAIVLSNCKIVAAGTPSELINNNEAKSAYFGESFKLS